jgi:hypothetical protein
MHDKYWRALQIFCRHVDGLSERRWKIVIDSQGSGGINDDEDLRTDETVLSAYRADLYVPFTPQKM